MRKGRGENGQQGAVGHARQAHKGQQQEAPGRRRTQERQNTQDADSHQHYGEPNHQQPAAVNDVSQGTGWKPEQEHREAGGCLHQRDEHRRWRESRHQPDSTHILHPHTEVGGKRSYPEYPKDGHEQWAPH